MFKLTNNVPVKIIQSKQGISVNEGRIVQANKQKKRPILIYTIWKYS